MPSDISSWLVHSEFNMAMRDFNNQNKFYFCIGNSPGHIVPEIRDLAENPPAQNANDML